MEVFPEISREEAVIRLAKVGYNVELAIEEKMQSIDQKDQQFPEISPNIRSAPSKHPSKNSEWRKNDFPISAQLQLQVTFFFFFFSQESFFFFLTDVP
jgi:hypothetical protein